jgi:hypothetical protein
VWSVKFSAYVLKGFNFTWLTKPRKSTEIGTEFKKNNNISFVYVILSALISDLIHKQWIIQLITFDKVDTMIYQPRRSDNNWGQRTWAL